MSEPTNVPHGKEPKSTGSDLPTVTGEIVMENGAYVLKVPNDAPPRCRVVGTLNVGRLTGDTATMTEQQTITEFLTARLDEDEDTARAAQDLMDEPWKAIPEGPEEENYSGGYRISSGGTIAGWVEEPKAIHIARHDPARVLREVEAKRRVLARHCAASEEEQQLHYEGSPGERACVGCGDYSDNMGGLEWNVDDVNDCPELRDLATVYADHPDYQEEWRP